MSSYDAWKQTAPQDKVWQKAEQQVEELDAEELVYLSYKHSVDPLKYMGDLRRVVTEKVYGELKKWPQEG